MVTTYHIVEAPLDIPFLVLFPIFPPKKLTVVDNVMLFFCALLFAALTTGETTPEIVLRNKLSISLNLLAI